MSTARKWYDDWGPFRTTYKMVPKSAVYEGENCWLIKFRVLPETGFTYWRRYVKSYMKLTTQFQAFVSLLMNAHGFSSHGQRMRGIPMKLMKVGSFLLISQLHTHLQPLPISTPVMTERTIFER